MNLATSDSEQSRAKKDIVSNMQSFHRITKDSRILGFFGLTFSFLLSMLFMFIGFHRIGVEGRVSMEIIFGVAGAAVFIISVRGAWMMTGGALTHVFSIDEESLCWGLVGKEQQLAIQDVSQIYWDESDGFTFVIITKDGKRIRFPYMASAVSYKSRPLLLRFFRTCLPTIPIEGHINKNTDQGSKHQSITNSDSRSD